MSHSNTPPVKKLAPLTTLFGSLKFVYAAEHHTSVQYSKMGRTKHRKHLPRSNLSWNTRQVFLKIPRIWEAALETEWRCFSKVKYHSKYIKVIGLLQHSCANSYWGWLWMHCAWHGDYQSLVLLAFNFILQMSHHSLTLPRSQFRDSTC